MYTLSIQYPNARDFCCLQVSGFWGSLNNTQHVLPGLRSTNEEEVGSDRPYSAFVFPEIPFPNQQLGVFADTIKGGWTDTNIKCLQMS